MLFHLGQYGELTAREICERGDLHKTKVSRAVNALEQKRFLRRERKEDDRRFEALSLTAGGKKAFADLSKQAEAFDQKLLKSFSPSERRALISALRKLYHSRSISSD